MDQFLGQLVNYGVAGVVAALAILALIRKDKQVNALFGRLEDKSDKMIEKYHQLGKELNETMKALVESLDKSGR